MKSEFLPYSGYIASDTKNYSCLIPLKFARLFDGARLPARATPGSVGFDLFSNETMILRPGEKHKLHLGIAWDAPKWMYGLVFARSGLSWQFPNYLMNSVGVIDGDYRGEWIAPIKNNSPEAWVIRQGDAIAQLVVYGNYATQIEIVEGTQLSKTERGAGGFGSTGR